MIIITNLNNSLNDIKWNVDEVLKFINVTTEKSLKDKEYLYLTDKISFDDDEWDFRYLLHPKGNYVHIFEFGKLSSTVYKKLLKRIVIQQLLINKKRFASVWYNFYYIRRFLLYLEDYLIYRVEEITYSDVKRYTEKLNYTNYDSKSKFSYSLKLFFYECDVHNLIDNKIEIINYLENYSLWNREKKFYKHGKTFNIPYSIQKNIVDCAMKDIVNNHINTRNKIIACAIVILFYTGMRRNELLSLEANKLKEISIFRNTQSAYILEFVTYKTVREHNGRWTKAKAFPELIYAYKELEKLTIPIRKKHESNYLFLTKFGNILSKSQLLTHIDNFFHKNQKEIGFLNLSKTELQQVKKRTFNESNYNIYGSDKNKDWINEPFCSISTHQFRVAFANNLKDKVSLEWIQEHMNHLPLEMTRYYFRDDEDLKETLLYKSNKDGTQLDTTLKDDLGSDEEMQQACEVINKFLSREKLNIFKDVDEILLIFKNNPFNESLVGLCSKAIILLCDRQDKLNTIENWYYNSPTIPSLVAVDFTIKRFFEKCKIVNHNLNQSKKNKIYERNFEVEKDSLNRFYSYKLLPEIKLLKSLINHKNIEELLEEHPNLEDTVIDLNKIEKEVVKWSNILTLRADYTNT
ncbi:tyrosine-type recombinase/integrase [Mammaliicoccus sciuri]|uniref:tyrosine-type recombinase/integrase n=1 Tax=Mammaliicoccus sciuri TaxID=1296 RepID=UPI001A997775|nr:site-specific integrase [Mammaliicoccus sciuri]MBO1232582.1 site-specific integrase [Mammaliicoccus sciuri]